MNRIRDKKRWWAANYCKQTVKPVEMPVFNMFGIGIAFLIISVALLSSVFTIPATAGVLTATITFGSTAAPSDIAKYFDALFTQSLPLSRKVITDNIGNSNAFIHKLIESDMYEGEEGGTHCEEPLMYALSPMESYDGYDELSTQTTDGVTAAIFEWRQLASPISYSMKELIQNKNRLVSLVKTKMTQLTMGIQEGFSAHFMQGSGDAALATPKVNAANSSNSIEPIAKLIAFDPTTSTLIGNVNQSTSTWWRNKTKTSAATTGNGLVQEWMNIFNSCSLGTGGQPDICLVDQTTYELCSMALWQKYRQTSSDEAFPFTNIRIPFGNGKSLLVLDDKVPDVYTGVTSTATYGTMYLLNSKFFRCRYIEGRNFEMLEDENGKTFVKPINQDSRVGHSSWMGQFTLNNRRKHGVFGKIARTLTFT